MDKNNLQNSINDFLSDEEKAKLTQQQTKTNSDVSVINNDKSLVERINKKIITEDGREFSIVARSDNYDTWIEDIEYEDDFTEEELEEIRIKFNEGIN